MDDDGNDEGGEDERNAVLRWFGGAIMTLLSALLLVPLLGALLIGLLGKGQEKAINQHFRTLTLPAMPITPMVGF